VRVRRSFSFLDLSGFTALTEAHGDERAVDVLGVFRSTLRDVCSRRGVRIAKWLGDGAMLVSVDTEPLVAATLEMKWTIDASPEPVTIKCGVTTGAVILLEGDDYIGHAVNVAARLCDLAVGREVLAVPSVVADVPSWALVEAADKIRVRGLERPIEIVRLGVHDPGADGVRDPVCVLPLTEDTAADRRRDGDGTVLLFCSSSCAETWDGRRVPTAPETGAIRESWMR